MRCGRRGKRPKEKAAGTWALKSQKKLLLETIENCSGGPLILSHDSVGAGLSRVALRFRRMLAGASVIRGLDWASTSKMAHVHDCCLGEEGGRLGPAGSLFESLPLSIKVHSFIHLFIYINSKRFPSIYQVLARVVVRHPSRRDIFLGSLQTQQLTLGR